MYLRLLKFLVRERLRFMVAGKPTTGQWCRVVMDQETAKLVKGLPYQTFSALEISGKEWAGFGFGEYESTQYPEFDICATKTEKKYDLIIAEQVFEHLLWPHRAAKNVFDMLKPGGYFLITTPFMVKVHLYPVDCTRWTETGLKYLLADCGFDLEQIKTGGWGNMEALISNLNKWTQFDPAVHSLNNEADYPVVIWGLAHKR